MDQLAEVCEQIASYGSRLRKIQILRDYLRTLPDDDFALAVRFLTDGPVAEGVVNHTLFETGEKPRLSIGHSILRDAIQKASGWDTATLRICYQEVGDTGETVGLLSQGIAGGEPLSLAKANELYQQLFRLRLTARKVDLLAEVFRTYRPLAIKYFVKVITGSLRIGLLEKMVEEAVAAACDIPPDLVKDANNRLGDLSQVALAARRGELDQVEARLFHPMDFMLAKPLDRLQDLPAPEQWIAEDKYDGIRSHVHVDRGNVRIYSRGLEDVTHSFPEIVEAFHQWPGRAVFDGELLAWRDNRALNFNVLQQRISRKQVRESHRSEIPVVFMAYDLLLQDKELLLAVPLEQRRSRLQEALANAPLPLLLSPEHAVATHDDIEQLFLQARERGNEGLILKKRGSIYEPGKRSGSWFKVKRPYGTLDVVITAAEQGQGKRATLLSDYTFAVRFGDGFVNVGKAYSGLTDPEVKELTRLLRAASVDRFGRVVLVKPQVVLEVAFDGVQKSSRHKSGYALRFPRILRWRQDKQAAEADNLERVEELYEASIR
jgi:DNA ligase 1